MVIAKPRFLIKFISRFFIKTALIPITYIIITNIKSSFILKNGKKYKKFYNNYQLKESIYKYR